MLIGRKTANRGREWRAVVVVEKNIAQEGARADICQIRRACRRWQLAFPTVFTHAVRRCVIPPRGPGPLRLGRQAIAMALGIYAHKLQLTLVVFCEFVERRQTLLLAKPVAERGCLLPANANHRLLLIV